MIEFPYLIALALLQQNGKRLMPIGGKGLKSKNIDIDCSEEFDQVGYEILLRVLQNSDNGPVVRASSDKSLMIVHLAMVEMQNNLPILKSNWINTGDTKAFINGLEKISESIWCISFQKNGGISRVKIMK